MHGPRGLTIHNLRKTPLVKAYLPLNNHDNDDDDDDDAHVWVLSLNNLYDIIKPSSDLTH